MYCSKEIVIFNQYLLNRIEKRTLRKGLSKRLVYPEGLNELFVILRGQWCDLSDRSATTADCSPLFVLIQTIQTQLGRTIAG